MTASVSCVEAAAALDELADLAELDGDAWGARAFRRAARGLGQLDGTLQAALAEGRVEALPGVGAGTVKRLTQLAESGTMQHLEELRAKLPPGLVELTRVPGLGPKRALVLHKELRIDSLAKLKDAAESGRLVALRGFGPKSQADILKGLSQLATYGQRLLLPEAQAAADALTPVLEKHATRVLWCGSLRRRRDTVGDLDAVVVVKDRARLVAALLEQPGAEPMVQGERKVSLRLASGLQVDVRFASEEEFGAAAVYFTGSKAHNIKLRALAIAQGLRLNEYGLFEVAKPPRKPVPAKPKGGKSVSSAKPGKTAKVAAVPEAEGAEQTVAEATLGARVAGASEEEVYAKLGVPFIPPELREDAGEVEVAFTGTLAELLAEDDLKGDLHNHTDRSDGVLSPEAWVKAAAQSGLAYLGLTDHSTGPRGGLPGWGLTGAQLLEHKQQVEELADKHAGKVKVFVGVEANILKDGDLDLDAEVLDQLDYVVAGVHTNFQMSAPEMTKRICTALREGRVDILSHPTGRKIGQRAALDFDREAVFRAAAESRTCLELDAQPDRLDLNGELARRARDLGCRFTIDSDGHGTPKREHLRWGVDQARRGWLTKKDVVNTLPASKVLGALKRK